MPDPSTDPLGRALRSLAGSAAQSAHGPHPEEIRSRGTRRRHRRIGAVAALSTAAVLAVGTVAVGATGELGGRSAEPPVATQGTAGPSETTEPPPAPGPLGPEHLPTDDQLPGFNEITGWRATSTYEGDGQAPISVCQRSMLSELGATAVWSREYTQTTDYAPGDTPDPDAVPGRTGISVAQFPDEEAAKGAVDEVEGWVASCRRTVTSLGSVSTSDDGESTADGRGQTYLVTYPAPSGPPDIPVLDAHGVGIAGQRIVLITQTQVGQDYTYERGATPIDGALTEALLRLGSEASLD